MISNSSSEPSNPDRASVRKYNCKRIAKLKHRSQIHNMKNLSNTFLATTVIRHHDLYSRRRSWGFDPWLVQGMSSQPNIDLSTFSVGIDNFLLADEMPWIFSNWGSGPNEYGARREILLQPRHMFGSVWSELSKGLASWRPSLLQWPGRSSALFDAAKL